MHGAIISARYTSATHRADANPINPAPNGPTCGELGAWPPIGGFYRNSTSRDARAAAPPAPRSAPARALHLRQGGFPSRTGTVPSPGPVVPVARDGPKAEQLVRGHLPLEYVPRPADRTGANLDSQKLIPDYLVLDGQQRLTSLSLALNGRGDHLFFADLVRLAGADVEGGIFPLRRSDAQRYGFDRRETQWERSVFPLSAVMGVQQDSFWFEDYVEFHVQRGEDREAMRRRRRFLEETYVDGLKNYRFPVVELPAHTELEAVCQIFEMLNKTGVRLTVFDLLTAKFWPKGLHLREELASARDEYPLLGRDEFDVESTFLLQAVSLLRSGGCKRGDLLAIDREDFETDWKRVCAGASEALVLLRSECGVLTRQWLPYAALFPALFAIAARIREMSGPAVASAWEKIKQWFWCCVFGQRYEGPVNTLNAADFRQLSEWIKDNDRVPEAVTTFSLEELELRTVERKRSAVYRGVICLTIVNGARDFYTGHRLTVDLLKDPNKRVEDHHIFPSGHLRKPPGRRPPENSILNRCLIGYETNRTILDKAPSRYLAEIETRVGVDALESILASHLIPMSNAGNIRADDLDRFLAARERLLLGAIAGVTGAIVRQEAPSDVYLDPAKPFMNELALRKVIRNLRGDVFWYEQHMSRKALEILAEELDRDAVVSILLLSGAANVNEQAKRSFQRFATEMASSGIDAEWRIVPDSQARKLHARVIFDDDDAWELPPLNSLLKGTVDSIRRSHIGRSPFVTASSAPEAKQVGNF
jgi:hypothetical protein